MPQYFKALATITAWTLWICSWIMGLSVFAMGLINDALYGSEDPGMIFPAFFAVALAQAIGAVVVMVLRKKME